MATVALGELGAILLLGLRASLADGGCRVLAAGLLTEELTSRLRAGAVDAVIVGFDTATAPSEAMMLATGSPHTPVIECSADRPVMRLWVGGRAPTELELTVDALIQAVRSA